MTRIRDVVRYRSYKQAQSYSASYGERAMLGVYLRDRIRNYVIRRRVTDIVSELARLSGYGQVL